MRSKIKHILVKMPFIKILYDDINRLKSQLHTYQSNMMFPPGHYYSPINDKQYIKKIELKIWKETFTDTIPGVDMNIEFQIQLMKDLSRYYKEIPFKSKNIEQLRYYFENEYYSYTDGIILYSMMRYFKPKNILEIGSGFSSALMMDTNDLCFDGSIQLEFIEPYPKRLYSLFKPKDREKTIVTKDLVQNVAVLEFKKLQAGDILFIDSSHVSKTGSDLNYILFEILPNLNQGVLIHFHDIFFPFEYPKKWVYQGRNWNENYILRAYLMDSDKYKIIHFSDFLHQKHPNAFKEMPLGYKNTGGSLWLEKN